MTRLTLSDCRAEVLAFALLMEGELRANAHKPGWKQDRPLDLAWRVRQEAQELYDITADLTRKRPTEDQLDAPGRHGLKSLRERVASEAADVGNMAMMVADVGGALPALDPSSPIIDRYRLTPGLPPDGTPGQFLAVDGTGNLWLLRWHRRGEWNALGFEEGIGADHPALRRGLDLQTLIVGHVMGPAIAPARAGITSIPFGGAPPFPAGDVEGAAGEMNGTAAGDRHPVGVRALGNR